MGKTSTSLLTLLPLLLLLTATSAVLKPSGRQSPSPANPAAWRPRHNGRGGGSSAGSPSSSIPQQQQQPPPQSASSSSGALILSPGGEAVSYVSTSTTPYCHSNATYHEKFVRRMTTNDTNSSKVEVFGAILKRHVQSLRRTSNRKVDMVFLVDESSSVGHDNFINELKFVKRLIADFTVDRYTTRVAVFTFSSTSHVPKHVDYLTSPSDDNHKCLLVEEQLPRIRYIGGATATMHGLLKVQEVFRSGRPDAKKVLFLITDGYSNSGDPTGVARALRDDGVEIFTFGIRDGNFVELCDMASDDKHEHVYILNTFEEFEALARRALHEDLHVGNYMRQNVSKCNSLCPEKRDCCDVRAMCSCGTHTGKYACICPAGYYGSGLKGECFPCPEGTYKNYSAPGDRSTCMPCPDPNHVTPAGCITEDECRCRRGYQPVGPSACAARTCPDITLPDNAYFVQGQCSNEINAACGIRCKNGYHLNGSSLRLCTEDGVWSGTDVKCEVKRCPPLVEPPNGHLTCTREDFSYDTHCHFACNPGYKLVGSKTQSCLAFAAWSGIPPKCREVRCPELPRLADGRVVPETCTARESPYGTICTMECSKGYKLNGVYNKQCMENGKWSPDDESVCIDVTPPMIVCPGNIETEAVKDEQFGTVSWEVPSAVDNSGFSPTVTAIPAFRPPMHARIGVTTVTYTAEDGRKNKARCSFSITVKDTQPPRIDKCVSPPPFTIRGSGEQLVTWEEPIFSDNSHEAPRVKQSHRQPQSFKLGVTRVHYTASDRYNNTSTCVIEIVVLEHACANHAVPSNGDLTCRPHSNGIECVPTCNNGYSFAVAPADKYYCDYDVGQWTPSDRWPVRDCSATKTPNKVKQEMKLRFKVDSTCKDRIILNQIETGFNEKIKQKVTQYCDNNVLCDIENFEVNCIDTEEPYKIPDNNIIPNLAVESRGVERHRSSRDRRQTLPNGVANAIGVRYSSNDTNALSTIVSSYDIVGVSTSQMSPTELTSSVSFVTDRILQAARDGEFDSILGQQSINRLAIEDEVMPAVMKCLPGSVRRGTECASCPAGTFFNVMTETCVDCLRGTYQPIDGKQTCLVCPEHTSTMQNSSKSIDQCRGQCLPGTFSPTGVEPCETCVNGTYQPSYAQTRCIQCPHDTTTWRRGSRTVDDCGAMCPEGSASKTGLEPCSPCPRGYYQSLPGQTACFRCPGDSETRSRGSRSMMDCENVPETAASERSTTTHRSAQPYNACFDEPCRNGATCKALEVGYMCLCAAGWQGQACDEEADECMSNPCQNNATCIDSLNAFNCSCSAGYRGVLCDVNIDECEAEPCLNNATCTDLVNAFRCDCSDGFNGNQCEVNVDDCVSNPCHNDGTCVDRVAGYQCQCSSGFQGTTCDFDIDECVSTPCQNNATCTDGINSVTCACKPGFTGAFCELEVDDCASQPCFNGATCENLLGSYRCQCAPAYNGTNCETLLSWSFDLHFPASGITNYALLEPGLRSDLTELTVVMRLRTNDRQNQGTPLSYATAAHENELVLTDSDGFVFYVGNLMRVTDVKVTDGYWHHVAATWRSSDGKWAIYLDGRPVDSGTGFAAGVVVEGGGVLVVGQEQDSRGSGFSSLESFVGYVHGLNIWNRSLSAEEIRQLESSCGNLGNAVAWPDFLAGIQGHVQQPNISFCAGCGQPDVVSNANVTWTGTDIGDTANYSCETGYRMQGSEQTICVMNSSWVGISGRKPYCSRVFCETLGPIENGVLDPGSKQTYGSRAQFRCYSKHRLVNANQLYCEANGTWVGQPPRCEPIICPPLNVTPPLLVDFKRTSGYVPDDSVAFNCASGYKIGSPRRVKCQNSGQWDGSLPSCTQIFCKSPPGVANGRLVNDTGNNPVPANSFVVYECNTAFRLTAGSRLECHADGQWSTQVPKCEAITCRPPVTIRNGIVDYLRLFVGSVATYSCQPGFTLTGIATIQCTLDGAWSGTAPSCDPLTCPPPGEMLHGFVKGDDLRFSAAVIYECIHGYVLVGSSRRSCNASGDWFPEEPKCIPRSCDRPSIDNGIIVNDTEGQYVFGDVVRFDCNADYRLRGSPQQTCLWNGTWSDEPPQCDKITCPHPGPLDNGKIDGVLAPQISIGSAIRYRCEIGYEVNGKDTRICRSDGTWTGPSVSCVLIRCSRPQSTGHGRFRTNDTGYAYGSSVEYVCDDGYILEGPSVRNCTEAKTWTGFDPRCVELVCDAPPAIPHGSFTAENNYAIGETISYRCDVGFILHGPQSRRCSAERAWTGDNPECRIIECEKPSAVISNGRMVGSNFSYSATVNYVCDDGYFIDGSSTRTCLAGGRWDTHIPICERVVCTRPIKPANSDMEGFEHRFRDKISYSCHQGFVLVGPSLRVCQANKTWSEIEPSCIPVECPMPQNIENGKALTQGIVYKSVVKYYCNPGYKLEGVVIRVCNMNGTWSDSEPRCAKIVCAHPPSIEFGTFLNDQMVAGTKVEYVCDQGYQLTESERLYCSDTGNFTGGQPKCIKVECPKPQPIQNGDLDAPGNNVGNILRYKCHIGFQLVGLSEIVCTANGTWSGLTPSCVRVTCPIPEYVPNAIVRSNGYEYGSNITYVCIEGHMLDAGSLERTCQANGTWSGSAPLCRPPACRTPGITFGFVASSAGDKAIESHVKSIDRFVAGLSVDFECEEGFRLVGQSHLTCLQNATWSGPIPTCTRVKCSDPQIVNSVINAPKGFAFGYRILIACEEGFELIGSMEATCLASGNWSTTMPVCRAIACEEPPNMDNMEIDIVRSPNRGFGYPFGITIGFTCDRGYRLEGARETTCRSDKTWSALFPFCHQITCSPPLIDGEFVPFVQDYKDSYVFEDQIEFRCNGTAQELIGSSSITCSENGSWSDSVPLCVDLVCPQLTFEFGEITARNGTLDATSRYSVGTAVTFECSEGYRLNGVRDALCTRNRTWSTDKLPHCELIICPTPVIINGRTVMASEYSEYIFGTKVLIGCDVGFTLPSGTERTATCMENGDWSIRLPSCIRVGCPPIPIRGARILYNSTEVETPLITHFSFGDVVDVDCLSGHNLVGVGKLTCEASGTWSEKLPVCERVKCTEPVIPNASVTIDRVSYGVPNSYGFGDVIQFVCDDGFTLDGIPDNLCMEDGTWSEPFPRCVPKHCPKLSIQHASIDNPDTEFGSRVRVTCTVGYELFGDQVLVCQSNSQWSGIMPLCIKVACKLPQISDARVVESPQLHPGPSSYDFGTQIDIQCLDGFELVGQSRLTCTNNRNWAPQLPTCRRVQCPAPNITVHNINWHVHAPNTTRKVDDIRPYVFGSRLDFDCDIGYRLVGSKSIKCEPTGRWSSVESPVCHDIFCPTPNITNGFVSKPTVNNTYKFGATIRLKCRPGFDLVGESEMFCQPNAEWTAAFPTCRRRSCPAAPNITHGSVEAPVNPAFEDVAEYVCEVGYELIGGNNATCLENREWSARPSCLLIRCPLPDTITHGTYIPSPSTYGSILRYACYAGYAMHGTSDHLCQANGTWSGTVPSCERVACTRPPLVPHADLIGDSHFYGDNLVVSCHPGYRLYGIPGVDCLANGTWSKVTATCRIISCGEPPYVRHADAVGADREFNSSVRYVCHAGYRLNEVVTESKCLSNGSWSQVASGCVRFKCPTPAIPKNGFIGFHQKDIRDPDVIVFNRPEGFHYRDSISVSCEYGYELVGPSARFCGLAAQWNGTNATCEAITCRQPARLPNVIFNDVQHTDDFRVGFVLNVSCETGFRLARRHAVACQHDRTWNGISDIECRRIVCPEIPPITNGHVIGDGIHHYGSQITFRCLPGYQLVGIAHRVCLANETWGDPASYPSCIPVNCSEPDVPAHGYVDGSARTFRSVVGFRCYEGFRLVGSSVSTCGADGRWNGSRPTCVPISCGPPPKTNNADALTNSTTYGASAEYRCIDGYEIDSGDRLRTCDSQGLWTGRTPTCAKVRCPEPMNIEDGHFTGLDFSFDAVVVYSCYSGYKLVGEASRRCQSDQTWSGTLPVCTRKRCPAPTKPSGGQITGVDMLYSGDVIEFACDAGHKLIGNARLTCTEDEMWSGHFPRCDQVRCGPPPKIANADAEGQSFDYGSFVTYVCRRGYKRSGLENISCQSDGTWNIGTGANATACERISCGKPPPVEHAKAVETGRSFGDFIYYVCAEGYDLNGNNLIECAADGRWSGSLPDCETITCGIVPVIQHASTIVHRATFGSRATYECNRGYVLQGSSTVECKANRTWAYETRPKCVPVDCGHPPEPSASAGTAVKYNSTSYGNVAVYYCVEGFRFAAAVAERPGATEVRCGEKGRWNATDAPACKPVACPTPQLLDGRFELSVDLSFGHDVKFSCNVGYQLVGDDVRTCQADGTWNGLQPQCELIYCDPPAAPVNGNFSVSGLHYGSVVSFWCMTDYKIVGAEKTTCGRNGTWTEPVPVCLPTQAASKKKCGAPPRVENAVDVNATFVVGDTVHYSCELGYRPAGSLEITCQDDLTWTQPSSHCEKVTCGRPNASSMVVVHGNRFNYGDKVAYMCRLGLVPVSVPILTCLGDGSWDNEPECKAICKFPCQNGGTCVGPNKCKCVSGFGGRNCEIAICILPCLNGGQCAGPYKCECPYGFTGPRCETPICVKPCQNGGRCVLANRCLCPHGFVPPFCEKSRYDAQQQHQQQQQQQQQQQHQYQDSADPAADWTLEERIGRPVSDQLNKDTVNAVFH